MKKLVFNFLISVIAGFIDFCGEVVDFLEKDVKKKVPMKVQIKNLALLLIIFLFITNPSMNTFKEFRNRNSEHNEFMYRVNNCFLFSIYNSDYGKYIGIAGNFFRI
ncbi:hypothetical protein ACVW0P_001432 [Mucilaginibacter sp. UYNi724]